MEGTLGEVILFAGNFAPRNWKLCHGQLISISQNQALFSLLGTTYGGDGRTTFALPDLRGRAAISQGSGPGLTPRRLGSHGGVETVTLDYMEIPSHTHAAKATIKTPCYADDGNKDTPKGNFLANDSGRPKEFNATANAYMAPFDNTVTVGPAGGSQPHINMPPFLTLNYIICVEGLFPSRS